MLDSRDAWKRAAEAAKEDLNNWRQRYELAAHTPDYKLDAEAAYSRGADRARVQLVNSLRAWMDTATDMSIEAPVEKTADA